MNKIFWLSWILAAMAPFAGAAGLPDSFCVIPANAPTNFFGPAVLVEPADGAVKGTIAAIFYWHGMIPGHNNPAGIRETRRLASAIELQKVSANGQATFTADGFRLVLPDRSDLSGIREGSIEIDLQGWTLHQNVRFVAPLADCANPEQ